MAGQENENILRLHLTERVGSVTYQRLMEHFGSSDAILDARMSDLAQVPGLGRKTAENVAKAKTTGDVESELAAAERLGVQIITYQDERYPLGLAALPDRPLVIYVRGEWTEADAVAVGVVGSRRCTAYGVTQAERLSGELAAMGVTVVSGLARGIDAAAHRAALRATGRTLAVVGHGLGKIYPRENRELADAITAGGAILSELPIATPPSPRNFPPRNRIISALSLGVVVVEAAVRSGAMITAKWANEQGKQVFAVPGPIDSPTSRGPHRLIREGAKLVEASGDIIEELGPIGPRDGVPQDGVVEEPKTLAMNEYEKRIYELLSTQAKTLDEIIGEAGLPPSIVSSTLMIMEIRRWVRQLAGQRYVKA